jgi:hypothetical protein
MPRLSSAVLALLLAAAACGDPAVSIVDARTNRPTVDGSVPSDDASTTRADASGTDDAADPTADAGGGGGDGGPVADDATPAPDAAEIIDGSVLRDGGVFAPVDMDGDNILDVDEGAGAVDTDGDGMPDTADGDSDGDGISDADEAGDVDPATPPVDTDGDGTPDFRDLDADDDGIPDAAEGRVDTDGDGTPNFLDTDSDGDGLPDLVEMGGDADADGTPNYLDTDADGDGVLDAAEGTGDPDGDTRPNFLDDDSDGDGLLDSVEGSGDVDGDGIRNALDTDSDGDGLLDGVEGVDDPDGDLIPNFQDLDADGDSIADSEEGSADPDGDQLPNRLDTDSDGDGLLDADEAGDADVLTPAGDSERDGTPNYLDLDSDDDGLSDTQEGAADSDGDTLLDRYDLDSDNDAIIDAVEAGDAVLSTAPVDSDMDGTPDYRDLDSDGDTIVDLTEGTRDTDADLTPDFLDRDSDGDSWLDSQEAGDADIGTPPRNSDADPSPDYRDLDSDDDGLADALERGCPGGSNRTSADSDNDGQIDPAEIAFGSNPCNGASIIDDFYFVLPPLGPEQRAPLTFANTGIDRADLAINVDTTGSMGEEITNIRTTLSTLIIPSVDAVIPDAAFAVSSFEDVPIAPFATPIDLPFRLGTRVTTQAATAQAAVNALIVRDGGDQPEGGLEALYRIASGLGMTWPGGSVPAFNPATNRVPGVADGTIGGVGFRSDSLPIIVQVTDAPVHERGEYVAVNAGIGATATPTIKSAIANIGARIVGIASAALPHDPYARACRRDNPSIFATIRTPVGTDVDWFSFTAPLQAQLYVEVFSERARTALDSMLAVYDAAGNPVAFIDDIAGSRDSQLALVTLSAPGTYYIAVTSNGDADFNGSGGTTSGYYRLETRLNGAPLTTSSPQCRADDGNTRQTATPLVPFAGAAPAADVRACVAACEAIYDSFVFPSGMASETGAVVPTCAWDTFGGRPMGCAANQCCTGVNGVGNAPDENGLCPLSFQVNDNGTGVGTAMVAGIQALVGYSTFTVTTRVRPDPVELMGGFDTTCFIHGVIPVSATTPNSCAPTPMPADLSPPVGVLDGFTQVVPGSQLAFDVIAQNQVRLGATPCRPQTTVPQLYRAFIDVVADGVTVLDTRDVTIIVPPATPGGSN